MLFESKWKKFLKESQLTFPFYDQAYRQPIKKQKKTKQKNCKKIFEDCLDGTCEESLATVLSCLKKLNIKFWFLEDKDNIPKSLCIEYGTRKQYWKTVPNILISDDCYSREIHFEEAEKWLEYAEPEEYINFKSPIETFWEDGGVVYHATPRENLESIKKYGLKPMCKTRGLANRNIGCAVFCSTNIESISSYGDLIFEIDISKMYKDGITYEISMETGLEENEMKAALAHKIGLDIEFEKEDSSLDEETIIIYGNIPPKYLTVVEE